MYMHNRLLSSFSTPLSHLLIPFISSFNGVLPCLLFSPRIMTKSEKSWSYPAGLGAGPDGALKDQETDGGEEYSSLPPPTVVRIHSAELFKNLLLYNDRTLWLIRLHVLTFSRIM